jgi:hypothetical protein
MFTWIEVRPLLESERSRAAAIASVDPIRLAELLEAERRGTLPADTDALLAEARRRGLLPEVQQSNPTPSLPPGLVLDKPKDAGSDGPQRQVILFGASIAIIPPAVILCLGFIVGWVVKGFRSS